MKTLEQFMRITSDQYQYLLSILKKYETDNYKIRPDGRNYAVIANNDEIMVHCLENLVIDESKRYWNEHHCILHVSNNEHDASGIGTEGHIQQIINAFTG